MESIPRRFLVFLVLLLGPHPPVGDGPPSLHGFAGAGAAPEWRDAPAYVELFAPVNERASYRAAVSSASLDDVLADIAGDASAGQAPGSWQARREPPADAFGTAGLHNRWLLKRLFGSRQVQVARGPRLDRGRVVESWTLISPYPSADLRTVRPGTLRLVLRIAQ